MKTKAIILNLVALTGVIGSFYLAWIGNYDLRYFMLGENPTLAPQDDPISNALGYIVRAANIASSILYGFLLSAIVLTFCSAAAIILKLKIVATGYGIAFDVPRNEFNGIRRTKDTLKKE